MIEDTTLFIIVGFVILVLMAICMTVYDYYDINEGFLLDTIDNVDSINEKEYELKHVTKNTSIENIYNENKIEEGTLIIAHASDDGTVTYHIIPTSTELDYGTFKQKIDNHDYRFIDVTDAKDIMGVTVVDVIPKMDLITGLPEYVSKNSAEYDLVWSLRYDPSKYKIIYKEDVMNMAPYSLSVKRDAMSPIHDIFIQTRQ